MRAGLALAAVVVAAAPARADDTELKRASLVYARGGALYKSDGYGKGETQLAPLPGKAPVVRALRTDPHGSVLLADVSGTWYWMPVDGSALVPLPCGDGPAQLDVDGTCVVCRGPKAAQIVNLKTGKATPVDVPAAGARIAGSGKDRKIVWADNGIWSAPAGDLKKRTKVAPEAPLRGFLPSPDGTRAVGVYSDTMYEQVRKKVPVDVLMSFALDGTAARRKGIRNGVPLDWTPDSQWVLVQDGGSACMMRGIGGEYKCYRGYTAVGIAPDASYVLMLGNRDGSKQQAPKPDKKKAPAAPDGDGGESSDADVPVPPPSGPLALYRGRLDGLYDSPAILTVKVVDGAAVWIPGK